MDPSLSKVKTSNILPIFDTPGYGLASTGILAVNPNAAIHLKPHRQSAFKWINRQELSIHDFCFNADRAMDTTGSSQGLFQLPAPAKYSREPAQSQAKPGSKCMFNQNVYKRRFTSQCSYTRVDKFRALLVRYDWRNLYFFAAHYIAFAMINLRIVTDF